MHQPSSLAGRKVLLRVLSALVLIPAAVLVAYLGGWAFSVLVGSAGVLILYEWNRLTENSLAPAQFAVQGVLLLAVVVLALAGLWRELLLTSIIGAVLTVSMARMQGRKPFWALGGLAYALVPAVALLWLRRQGDDGFALCIWLFALVWATDIGGYLAGKAIGGPRLAPRISPNKTWAGLAGGVGLSAFLSASIGGWFGLGPGWAVLALIGALLAVWAQVGDLAESAVKRRFGAKDSGSIIPGHGGIMDRVDGLVFAAPVVAAGVYLVRM